MTTRPVRVTVNGVGVERYVEPRRRLAEFVRDDLDLRGTKLSCEVQVCGACTVLVDGRPVSSCTALAVDVDGCSVTTIEGVAQHGELHLVQQAFVDVGAIQCGFCTPGFVLATLSLLDEVPDPTPTDVRHHLDGNLCRCTGYEAILDAVMTAVQRLGARE